MKTKHLKLIEKYYNGEMSPEEKETFELNRKNDPSLDQAFIEYGQILEALKDMEVIELRKKLNELRAEGKSPGNIISFLRGDNNWIWLAALLILIVAMTVLLSYVTREMPKPEIHYLTEVMIPDSGATDKLSLELRKFSTRNNGMKLEVLTRGQGFFWRENINFYWTVDSTYNLLLDVLNQEGNIVFVSHQPLESPYVFKRRLRDGSYIFRFRDDKETFGLLLIHVN